MTRPKNRTLSFLALALLFVCCASLPSCVGVPTPTYVGADRDTFNAIAPEYRLYVEEDEGLTTLQKDRRLLNVTLWEERLEAAGAAMGESK